MNSAFLKKALPHIIAIVLFLVVAIIYCKPALQGMVVNQQDTQQYRGMAQQSVEYREKYGHYPLWTESMFGGMPAYVIALEQRSPILLGYLMSVLTLGLPGPIGLFFMACVCMYILTQVLRINPWLGALAALAYAYSTYDAVIIVVGHITKMQALALAPGVIASLLLIFQRKWLWGAALLTCFFCFQVGTNHLQVVYYTVISAGFLTLYYLIDGWKEKKQKDVLIGAVIAACSCTIGFLTIAVSNLPTAEYAKETMRGGRTELKGASKTGETIGEGGLSKGYAFNWSYGIPETITLLIPNGQGGGSDARMITGNSKFVDKLAEVGVPEDNALGQVNYFAYWGEQPNTAGAPYLGAVCWLLFMLGLVYVKGWRKWWLVSVAITGTVLAWGSNFATVNNFLFDHLPYYNKFRAPTIALIMPQFAIPLLGALGLDELLKSQDSKEVIWKKFKRGLIYTAGLLVVAIGFYFTASYKGGKDASTQQRFVQMAGGGQSNPQAQQQAASFASSLMGALRADRQSLYGSDLLRTIILIALSAGLILLYLKGKYKQQMILLGGLLVLSSFDLLAVGKRYLTDDVYVDKTEFDSNIAPPSAADQRIMADPEKGFRVYDEASGDPYNSARASYHHNSVGGYSPAKMGLYQDIIEHQLSRGNMGVFDMLNTKYFIQPNPANGQPEARINPGANGPCWLVKSIHYVKDGNEEMKALDSINLKDTVVIQQVFKPQVKSEPVEDSTAKISLIDNRNDTIDYKFSARTNQFAVFSEIYYDKGWDAYIDGKKADYVRVDYILRGMSIPAGDHTIEFRFEPHSYWLGDKLSNWFSLLGYLLLLTALGVELRKRVRKA
ncbi:MAG: hypothetical protein BGO55_00430 [Sphingobacteriales bacterium 50-39]|nr:YfhO family protein [Sphingobacteriales bacterium]OJW53828.1 MAG: hypothetical protein BGO55_00430 [Sphingobacteriales bacterium 50-39]